MGNLVSLSLSKEMILLKKQDQQKRQKAKCDQDSPNQVRPPPGVKYRKVQALLNKADFALLCSSFITRKIWPFTLKISVDFDNKDEQNEKEREDENDKKKDEQNKRKEQQKQEKKEQEDDEELVKRIYVSSAKRLKKLSVEAMAFSVYYLTKLSEQTKEKYANFKFLFISAVLRLAHQYQEDCQIGIRQWAEIMSLDVDDLLRWTIKVEEELDWNLFINQTDYTKLFISLDPFIFESI